MFIYQRVKFGVVISKSIIDQWEIRLNELPIAGILAGRWSHGHSGMLSEMCLHEMGEEMGTIWKHPIIIRI